jgi:hypothetical protein
MLRSLRFVLLVAVSALVALSAATAVAAPASWQKVDVTLHSEQSGGAIMLISGELPTAVSLPAQAELSAPAGSEVQWIGELLGGPASEDPELKYTKSTKGGVDTYRFTLTKSRAAQVEIPSAEALGFDGTSYNAALKWTAAQNIPEVRISVRVPQNAQITQPAPGASFLPAETGYKLYAKTIKNVKAGDAVNLAFTYTTPVAAPSTAGTASAGSNWVVPTAILLVIVGVGAAFAMSVRRKLEAKSSRDGGGSTKAANAKNRASSSGTPARKGAEPQRTSASESETEPEAAGAGLSGSMKRNLVTAGIIGVLVVAAFVIGGQTTKPKSTGETITKKFSQAEPCANVVVALNLPEGADSQSTADKLFEALAKVKGLNTVTYNGATSSIDVGYCESQSNETVVRQALQPTGLVAEGAAAPSAAPTATP